MRKLLTVLALLLFVFSVGCSNASKADESIQNDNFEGAYGTYEWIKTEKMEDDSNMGAENCRLYHIIRYTNTTNQAVMPEKAIREEMELQHETEIELNNLGLQGIFVHEDNDDWVNENLETVKNTYKNIKPGATVDFAMETIANKDRVDSVYLRNRIKTPTDKVIFEKKIIISTP